MSRHLGRGPEPWEIAQQGKTVVERTAAIAEDIRDFHALRKSSPMTSESIFSHSQYIHEMGTQMLKIQQVNNDSPKAQEVNSGSKFKHRLYRKRITVDEVEKTGKMIAMDLDWDTTSWTQEEIEAGCETLIMVFQKGDSNDAYEEQALKMLEKLMHRHKFAVAFMRKNIETLLSKAVSRRLNRGRTGGVLPLLNVLNICTSRFSAELSTFNAVGRMIEMLILEPKLAAVLIQHTYRVHYNRNRPRPPGQYDEGFGTSHEMERQKQKHINARSSELRSYWRTIHGVNSENKGRGTYGMNGPIHIGIKYTKLVLNIIVSLVSDSTGTYATINREDVNRAGGLILLSGFVHATNGPYWNDSLKILKYVSKVPESLLPILQTGCINSLLKLYKVLRKTGETACSSDIQDIILVIRRLGEHAAALFRANKGYKYMKTSDHNSTEDIDYSVILSKLDKNKSIEIMQSMLSSKELLIEFIDTILKSIHTLTVSNVLLCLFTLTCSDCYRNVLAELLAFGSRGLVRVVQLLEEDDLSVSMPALYLLLQLCTREDCRGGMSTSRLADMLKGLVNRRHASHYTSPGYQRGLLALTALCRRGEWRAYDPEELPKQLEQKNAIINAIYIDLLTIVKAPEAGADLDMADMLVMPTNKESARYLSVVAERVGSSEFCSFLARPDDPRHFQSLPWITAACGCIIIEAIVMHPSAAAHVLSTATVRYLGQCVYLSFLELCEQSIPETRTTQMLYAIISASKALNCLCSAAANNLKYIPAVMEGVMESHSIQASNYFAMTLATIHPSLSRFPHLKYLQEKLGLESLGFLDSYCKMLLSSQQYEALVDVANCIGKDMSEVN